jgi:soluble lytic murein transglycosylase
VFVLTTAGLFVSAASADIFMYVDRQGIMHFSNVPTSSKYRPYMRETGRRILPSPARRNIGRYDGLIADAARRLGVAEPLIKAVIHVESGFNPTAVSKRGALGLMQIMPYNLKRLRVHNPFDPSQNIMGGARYLKQMLQRFKGNTTLALAAYNAGPGAVEQHRSIPPFRETKNYVRKVLRYYRQYRKG